MVTIVTFFDGILWSKVQIFWVSMVDSIPFWDILGHVWFFRPFLCFGTLWKFTTLLLVVTSIDYRQCQKSASNVEDFSQQNIAKNWWRKETWPANQIDSFSILPAPNQKNLNWFALTFSFSFTMKNWEKLSMPCWVMIIELRLFKNSPCLYYRLTINQLWLYLFSLATATSFSSSI